MATFKSSHLHSLTSLYSYSPCLIALMILSLSSPKSFLPPCLTSPHPSHPLSLHPGAQRLGTTTVYWIGGDLLCSTFLKSPSMGPEELELRVYSRQSPRRVEHRIAIIALPAARLLSPGGCPSLGSQQGREVQRVNHSAMLASINGFIVRSSLIRHEAPFSSRCACP